jgi:hypothetical protein
MLGRSGLAGCVGERFTAGEATIVPLPHPSGRSTWLNAKENHDRLARAINLIHEELGARG